MDASFTPFGSSYRGPISIATGWLAGSYGGAEAIAAGQLSGAGTVKVFSTGTALQGNPTMYLRSAMMHDMASHFTEIASFKPFAGASGVRVATTSTTIGADLLASGVRGGKRAHREVPPHALEPASARAHRDARARGLVGNGNGSGGARRRLARRGCGLEIEPVVPPQPVDGRARRANSRRRRRR